MRYVIAFLLLFCLRTSAAEPTYTRQQDVIYGRKFGMALTMDVFRPVTGANKAGILLMCSGGWFSSHDFVGSPPFMAMTNALTSRGYTVFSVVHGSQPRFTIPDVVSDIHRAARFIRYSAHAYGIDPDRLGITGASSGGHLSLMEGVAPLPGDPKSVDPVERVESRVEAVACFFPPTDFLNYGAPGKLAWETNLNWLLPPFDFQTQNKAGEFFPLLSDAKLRIARQVSPIYLISAASAPTLIIQGDADILVPYEQSQRFIAKLKTAGVPAQLIIRHGKNHGWPNMEPDFQLIGDWFDRYLLQSSTTRPVKAEP
jgi:acetyl esterase/lipase